MLDRGSKVYNSLLNVWLASGFEKIETPQSVALWEKRGNIPRWADHFIRALYREIAKGNAQIQQLIERHGDIDRGEIDKHERARQEYEEHEGAWHTRAAA